MHSTVPFVDSHIDIQLLTRPISFDNFDHTILYIRSNISLELYGSSNYS